MPTVVFPPGPPPGIVAYDKGDPHLRVDNGPCTTPIGGAVVVATVKVSNDIASSYVNRKSGDLRLIPSNCLKTVVSSTGQGKLEGRYPISLPIGAAMPQTVWQVVAVRQS